MVDSRAYLSAKRRKETEVHCPPEGTRIAFSGGDYQAYDLIWSVLDATLAKYPPDMVLLHGGTPKGAEMIAARWQIPEVSPRWSSGPTGRATGRPPPPSSAMTRCWRPCPPKADRHPPRFGYHREHRRQGPQARDPHQEDRGA